MLMRRWLQIQVVFEPVRLSADHLRSAYERVAPIARREIIRAAREGVTPQDSQDRQACEPARSRKEGKPR
jgi:hypothetical protein